MERLTTEICGSLLVKNSDIEHRSPCFACDNIGYCKPEKGRVCGIYKALEKLKYYEDLQEQNKLLILQCQVGDRIYRIDTDEKIKDREMQVYDIDNIVILADGTVLLKYDAYDGVICELENIITDKPYMDYYRCFINKEQAEAALNELEGRNES